MDKSTPRVSIGLPVYNGEKHLRKALESIVAQTFEDFELTISDNASIDRTEQICRDFMDKDPRVKYYRQDQNLGAVRNFNLVFELSRGKYFKWMGCDDWLHPEFLAYCVRELDNDPSLVLCYCREKYYSNESKFICSLDDSHKVVSDAAYKRFHQIMWTRSLIDPTYAVVRRSALSRTRLISTLLQADDILAAELSLLGPFGHIPEYLSFRIAQVKTNEERMARIELQPKTMRLEFSKLCLEYSRIIRGAKLNLNPIEKALLLVDLANFFICCQIRRRLFRDSASRRVCPKPLLSYLQKAFGQ